MLQITRNPEEPLDPEHVFASTVPDVTIAPSVRVGLVGDGDPICELVASISRVEPGRVVTTDVIVTDLEDWAPDATCTGHELAEKVLDEIVDLINEALSNALHLVATVGAS